MWQKRAVHQYTLTLGVEDRQFQAKAWAPISCVPGPGDLIEIAIGRDGRVALDCDERYDGPPGRALVFTTPPRSPPNGPRAAGPRASTTFSPGRCRPTWPS